MVRNREIAHSVLSFLISGSLAHGHYFEQIATPVLLETRAGIRERCTLARGELTISRRPGAWPKCRSPSRISIITIVGAGMRG